ncbi:unnamed protein product [Amoebophrya sp. A25]|nr:unnamed protein product [Amoebophrya sp. A25]|eukprot:GSA25T00015875001.1
MFSFFSVSARVAALLLYLQLLVSFSRTSSAFARRAEGHDSQRSALLQTGPRSSSSTRRVADHPYKITIRNRSPSRSRSLDLYARSQEQNAHPSIEATTRPTSSTRRTPSVEVVEHIIEPRHRSPLRYGVAPGRGSGFPGGLNPLSGFIGAGATRGSPTSAGGRGGGSLSRFPPSTTAHFAGPSPGMFQAMIMGQTFAGRGRNHVTLQNPQVFQIQPARGRSASPSRGIFASPRAAPSPPGSTILRQSPVAAPRFGQSLSHSCVLPMRWVH